MADASDITAELPEVAVAGRTVSAGAQRVLQWVVGIAGAALYVFWALASGWVQPVQAVDVDQQRLNVAVQPPFGDEPLVQTFRPAHGGLSEVEILLARSGEENEGRLTLRLLDQNGAEIASQSWAATQLRHNQTLVLRFAPQPDSAGREYRLVLQGEGGNPFGAWAYDLDVYEGGALVQAPGAVHGDLRFTTRYRLSLSAAVQELGALFTGYALTLVVSLLLLPLPGCLILLATCRRIPRLDLGAWWSLALALGLAAWPLLWYWSTLAGFRWTQSALIVVVVGGWLAAVIVYVRRRRVAPWRRSRGRPLHVLLLVLLVVALAVRLLAIRDLAFPPWVDSSRHALITTIMVERGQTPDDYHPYLPVDDFSYHFGFHTLAAGVQMLTDGSLPRTLLGLGQLLNALAALSVYGGAWIMTRKRGAAMLAAFLVALPFFFPAYYLTWGRFTQMAGALLLAPLVGLTWQLARGSRGWRRVWWVVAILAAGLFLVHLRVFLVYLPFVLLVGVAACGRGGWRQATGRLLGATILGLLLVAPRMWELALAAGASSFLSSSDASYAEFPVGYVTTGWERWFLILGGLTFLGSAILALRQARPPRRGSGALAGVVLGGWAGLVALLLSGRVPVVPLLWLINLNSAYILIFVPLALLLATGFAPLWSWLAVDSGVVRRIALISVTTMLGAAIAAGTLFGARQQASIVNETTILARAGDGEALAWMAAHLPPDARVAVNSWRWLGATWAAGDGGAWLLPLTGLQATTPPVDYIENRDLFETIIAFNEAATDVEDWSNRRAAEWLAQQGVTHVYVGERGGFLDPSELVQNEGMEMIYGQGGVFVLEIGD